MLKVAYDKILETSGGRGHISAFDMRHANDSSTLWFTDVNLDDLVLVHAAQVGQQGNPESGSDKTRNRCCLFALKRNIGGNPQLLEQLICRIAQSVTFFQKDEGVEPDNG